MIGIIGAMEIETNGLIAKMTDTVSHSFGEYKYTVGKLNGKDLVVCRCGIGKVFSSTASVLMIHEFKPSVIINIGVAGGAKPLKQGDVVVANKTVQHDCDSTADGLQLGQVNGFDSPYFDCDADIVSKLDAVLTNLGHDHCVGTIASGDCFVNSKEKSSFIINNFGASAFDMESAAIHQVCKVQNVPFCSMRAISDNGDDEALKSFYQFAIEAAEKAINVICEFVTSF